MRTKNFLVLTVLLLPWVSNASSAPSSGPIAASWKGVKRPIQKTGNYFLPTGFVFEAVLEGAVFSYNLMTPAAAVLDEDLVYKGEVVLPQGSQLIGSVQVVHSLDRVNIDFKTCVFPDGQQIPLDGMALSMDGSAGVKGKVQKHKDAAAARLAMRSILTGVQVGASMAAPTVESAMTSGVTQEALSTLDTGKEKVIESIYIEERAPIKIFLRDRIDF